MTTDTRKLMDMKDKIEKARRESDQAQGAIDQLGERLKTEFKVKSTQEADKLLTQIDKDLEALEQDIDVKTKELEAKYDWN